MVCYIAYGVNYTGSVVGYMSFVVNYTGYVVCLIAYVVNYTVYGSPGPGPGGKIDIRAFLFFKGGGHAVMFFHNIFNH